MFFKFQDPYYDRLGPYQNTLLTQTVGIPLVGMYNQYLMVGVNIFSRYGADNSVRFHYIFISR